MLPISIWSLSTSWPSACRLPFTIEPFGEPMSLHPIAVAGHVDLQCFARNRDVSDDHHLIGTTTYRGRRVLELERLALVVAAYHPQNGVFATWRRSDGTACSAGCCPAATTHAATTGTGRDIEYMLTLGRSWTAPGRPVGMASKGMGGQTWVVGSPTSCAVYQLASQRSSAVIAQSGLKVDGRSRADRGRRSGMTYVESAGEVTQRSPGAASGRRDSAAIVVLTSSSMRCSVASKWRCHDATARRLQKRQRLFQQ